MSGSTKMIPYQGFLRWLCLLSIVVFACAFAFFVFMIIFSPQELKFTIIYASLAEFNLTRIGDNSSNNNALSYNLTIDVAIRNPNKKVGVYFDRIEALANYGEELGFSRFNSVLPFYQGHKNTTTFCAIFEGQRFVTMEEYQSEIDRYNLEKSSGVFSIEVKINIRMRTRYGKIRTGHFKNPKFDCKLKVPLLSSKDGTYSLGNRDFEATSCADD